MKQLQTKKVEKEKITITTKNDSEVLIDEILSLDLSSNKDWEPGTGNNIPRYVVVRDGFRVSDKDYFDKNDPKLISEKDFWKRVVNKFPDGTRVEITEYDKRKHRIW